MILAYERISPGLQLAQPQSAAVVAGDHLFDPQIVRLKFLSRRVLVPDDQHGALTRRHDDLRWREDMILDGDVYADRLVRGGWAGFSNAIAATSIVLPTARAMRSISLPSPCW